MSVFIEKYLELHPERAARLLEGASCELVKTVLQEYTEFQESIIKNFSPTFIGRLLDSNQSEFFLTIFSELSVNTLTTIASNISVSLQEQILDQLSDSEKSKVEELLSYDIDQVGHYLEDCDVVLNENSSIATAMEMIEKLEKGTVLFVVSSSGEYQGTLNLYQLIKNRHQKNESIKDMLDKNYLSLKASTPIKNIIYHKTWIEGHEIPVLSKTNCLLGIFSERKLKKRIFKINQNLSQEISTDKLISAYETLWEGMHKFWGGVK